MQLRKLDSEPEPAAEFPIKDLLVADAFPHEVTRIALRETHISWVVLTGQFAYKIKKSLKHDFIDASTLERRRQLCEAELRLNRRLAPELYLDVVRITRRNGRAVIGGDGPVLEYAVRMQQFSASDELPSLLAREVIDAQQFEALGESLAQFHLHAPAADPERAPERTEETYQSVFGNLALLLTHFGDSYSSNLSRLIDWTHDTARALEPTLQARERRRLVRECHGDLHAGNIVRHHDRLVPFDCIEFNDALRWIDVIDDIAFLVMDLASHERADLAFTLLSRYLEVTGDYEGVHALRFFAVYRALVRAKVDALAAEQVPARAAEFHERLRRRVGAAVSWAMPRVPTLILMHGASGSGKSWLSRQLVPELQAVRIRSDIERKRLAGIGPDEPAGAGVGAGIYAPQFSHRTYARMAECAEHCLRAGLNVIVDAAFLDAADRELFRALAERLGAHHFIVSCQADPIALARRVLERSAQRRDPSDATLEVLDHQLRRVKPFEPSELAHVIAVATSERDPVRQVMTAIHARAARA